MPPKRGNAKLKQNVEEGLLGKTDNGMRMTTFSTVAPINQKNFYTEYLKKDDQIWSNRQVIEDQKAAREAAKIAAPEKPTNSANGTTAPVSETASRVEDEDVNMEDGSGEKEMEGQRVIVIHPGSRNLRIGLASDAFPKTVPCCIARLNSTHKPSTRVIPKRSKTETGEISLGAAFERHRTAISQDFRARMRYYKRRILPNAAELVNSYNSNSQPEIIPEHNDVNQVEWTDTSASPRYLVGSAALLTTDPRYDLLWPILHGVFNERDYKSARQLLGDMATIIADSVETELSIEKSAWSQYSIVLVLPDLFDRTYVRELLQILFVDLSFGQVAVVQESVAATFGAGVSGACVVDVGAQTTSICCVDEGMCVADSRINMKYGGDDITLFFTKVLLRSMFPYQEVNLAHMHDWILMQDLKAKFCTVNDADINTHLYHFYQNKQGQRTKKYTFKVYDEVIIAPMAFFYPQTFVNATKNQGRFSVLGRSLDIYDGTPNNPESTAQKALLSPPKHAAPKPAATEAPIAVADVKEGMASDVKPPIAPGDAMTKPDTAPAASVVAPPEQVSPIPVPPTVPVPATQERASPTPKIAVNGDNQAYNTRPRNVITAEEEAALPEVLPFVPLDHAIIRSITEGCKGDEDRIKRMYLNIMLVGSGASFPGFTHLVEERLRYFRPGNYSVTLTPPPREMDPQMLVWKGGSVFAKLQIVNECWIKGKEWDVLGTRCLQYKVLFLV